MQDKLYLVVLGVTLALLSQASVQGRVLRADGTPVANATVHILYLPYPGFAVYGVSVTTDYTGTIV